MVLAPKPVISDDASGLEPHVLQQLLGQIGSLASVYQRPADTFVSRQRLAVARAEELQVRGAGLGMLFLRERAGQVTAPDAREGREACIGRGRQPEVWAKPVSKGLNHAGL